MLDINDLKIKMFTKALLIVVVYLLIYPFFNHDKDKSFLYYVILTFILAGYFYCLILNLYKLKRSTQDHEFKDEEEKKVFFNKNN